MKRRKVGAAWRRIVFVAPFLITAAVHQGCSRGGYEDAHSRMAMASIVVSPETLDGWLTRGYGTDSFGYNRLVVLDVSSTAGYAAGHVPGAFNLDTATDLIVSRSDGIGGTYSYSYFDGTTTTTYADINAPAEVATRDMMNAVIQRTGITGSTVVAIVGDTLLNAGLAYFNFRYWGFPKERLRVLDRTKAAWVTAGYSLSTEVPAAPAPSTYGVCDLVQDTSLRATLTDMIQLARGALPGAIAWDVRNANEYNGVAGATAGPFAGKAGYAKKVAFEGHLKGAVFLPYNTLLGDAGARILDQASVLTALQGTGIGPGVRTHIY